jgi:hypothetical protein
MYVQEYIYYKTDKLFVAIVVMSKFYLLSRLR